MQKGQANYFERKQNFLLSLYLFEEMVEQDIKHLLLATQRISVCKGNFVYKHNDCNDCIYLIWYISIFKERRDTPDDQH